MNAEIIMNKINNSINRKAFKSGIWYTFSNFFLKAATFLTTPIFTRLLSTGEIGQFANYSSWLSILAVIVTFDLFSSLSIAKFDYKDKLDEYISSTLVLGSTITFLVYVFSFRFKDSVLSLLNFTEVEFHLAFCYFLFYPAMQMFQLKSRFEYKYKTSVFLSFLSVFLSIAFSVIFIFVFQSKFIGRVVGYSAPLIVINLIIYIYLIFKGKKISSHYWKYSLVISFPLIWHTLATHILSSGDRIMVNSICGNTAAAMYSVAYTCAMVVQVLWNSMNTAWSPWVYDKMNLNEYGDIKKYSRFYILFFGFVAICFLLFSPEILLIMGGNKYLDALDVIPPVMVSFCLQFVYSLYVNIEFYHKKQIWIAVCTIAAAAINIGLNYIFIPLYGYVAAAYTTLVGYLVLFFLHFTVTVVMKKSKIYDTKFNFLFLLFMFLMIPVCVLLYKFAIIRYIIIGTFFVIFAVLVVVFWKEIVYTIKNKNLNAFKERIGKKNK